MGSRSARAILLVSLIGLGGCAMGPTELMIILAIVVLLFGATRLPQLGRALGETLNSFRDATSDKPDSDKALAAHDESGAAERSDRALHPLEREGKIADKAPRAVAAEDNPPTE